MLLTSTLTATTPNHTPCGKKDDRFLCNKNPGFYITPGLKGLCLCCQQELFCPKNVMSKIRKLWCSCEMIDVNIYPSITDSNSTSLTPSPFNFSFSFLKYLKGKKVEADTKSLKESENDPFSAVDMYEPNIELQKTTKQYKSALKSLGTTAQQLISLNIFHMVEHIKKTRNYSVDQVSNIVQNFYFNLEEILYQHPLKKGSSYEKELLLIQIEKYITTRLHSITFEKICKEMKQKDLEIHKKIGCLHWISPVHIDAPIDETDEETMELVDLAAVDINGMDFKISHVDKLQCIMNCSRKIFAILQKHHHRCEGSADNFLPILVYIVLKANPPNLYSNIQFISKFSINDRILKGEEGYYFTHLCSVLLFIENISFESLEMSKEQFEENIENPSHLLRSDILSKLLRFSAKIAAYQNFQDNILKKSMRLQESIRRLKEDIAESINSKRSTKNDTAS